MTSATAHNRVLEIASGEDHAGARLDRFLASKVPDLSRSRIQDLIRDGHLSTGGATIREPRTAVKPGMVYALAVPEAEDTTVRGEAMSLAVVYEDDEVIVIDKPAGLVVHPAAGHASGTLVNALIAHCGASLSGIGGVKRPGIVHRLDKDTSGLLVVAKTDLAHQSLSEQFKSHGRDGRLTREYLALSWGVPDRPTGTIDAPLARSLNNRTKIIVVRRGLGREAITHYAVDQTFAAADAAGKGGVSLLRLALETGRTHQIRVHLAHIGHPVLADPTYGTGFKTRELALSDPARAALTALNRQALHAAHLGFEHPKTGAPLSFDSPLPADMARLVTALAGDTPPAGGAKPRRRPTAAR